MASFELFEKVVLSALYRSDVLQICQTLYFNPVYNNFSSFDTEYSFLPLDCVPICSLRPDYRQDWYDPGLDLSPREQFYDAVALWDLSGYCLSLFQFACELHPELYDLVDWG